MLPTAICIDRHEGHPDRRNLSPPVPPTHYVGDVQDLPFKDGVLDCVFSSHCLDDIEDTAACLKEWARVLKVGGYLVIYSADERAYLADCAKWSQGGNTAHKHKDFSLRYVKERLPVNCVVAYELFPVPGNTYSFDLVAQKVS
jgi:ubiquinone/menaquinone biosynthesis C-methylase UbiE